MLSACCFGLDSANGVSRGQQYASKKKRNNTAPGAEQAESCGKDVPEPKAKLNLVGYSAAAVFRLLRFQYKYPGTPISTIAVPQNASVGRVMIVFSVHAVPIST